jgi:carnosine N-methyltransferase
MADDDDDNTGERQHFASILRAYDNYLPWAMRRIARLERDLSHLSERHRQLLHTDDKIEAMRTAVQQNASVLKLVVDPHRQTAADADEDRRQQVMVEEDGRKTFQPAASAGYVPESDMEKLQSTLKQFVREWGSDGAHERSQAHGPMLEALEQLCPARRGPGEAPARVLVPGAGLGRLAWEVARRGYQAQGSEFSYFMLIAGNFILNRLQHLGPVHVHPWALQTTNQASRAQQARSAAPPPHDGVRPPPASPTDGLVHSPRCARWPCPTWRRGRCRPTLTSLCARETSWRCDLA